jgi:hypothetical protein
LRAAAFTVSGQPELRLEIVSRKAKGWHCPVGYSGCSNTHKGKALRPQLEASRLNGL